MKKKSPQKGRPGRRPTGHRSLPAVRLPGELYQRLAKRLALIASKTGMKNLSKYVRESLAEKLDRDDRADRAAQRKHIRRLQRNARDLRRSRQRPS